MREIEIRSKLMEITESVEVVSDNLPGDLDEVISLGLIKQSSCGMGHRKVYHNDIIFISYEYQLKGDPDHFPFGKEPA